MTTFGGEIYGASIYGGGGGNFLTIVATPSVATASVFIDVEGVFADFITVFRTNTVTGAQTNVRGAFERGMTGLSSFTVTDYECPLDVPVTYTAQVGVLVSGTPAVTNQLASSVVTISSPTGTVWLKNLSSPSLSQTVTLNGSPSDPKYSARSSSNYVVGRQNAVIISDVHSGRSGSLTFFTADLASRTAFLGLLQAVSSSTLFIQFTPEYGFEDMYFVPGDIQERRTTTVSYEPSRFWDISYTEQDSPSDTAISVGSNTWLAVMGWNTWQHVLNQRSTWLDVLNTPYGARAGDTP